MNLWRNPPQSFEGLQERCAPGALASAVALLDKHRVPPGPVLDLASGSGALLARLRHQGFDNFTAVELDAKKFAMNGTTPLAFDLNADFAPQFTQQFGLVTATEIVEHLENPRHFLRQIHALLRADGCLLISTPNVTNLAGRLKFLLKGELRYFDASQYHYNHHITPITDTQMKLLLTETGFRFIDSVTAGTFFGALPRLLFAGGDVNIYLCAKDQPRPSTPIDWS